ncbi:protoporphyrinogen oxidase [soil metagenome]
MKGHCVVVGAGISGLAAAWHLSSEYPQVRITVVDCTDRIGGKIAAGAIAMPGQDDHGQDGAGEDGHEEYGPGRYGAGGPLIVDTGAESVLARRPEALTLIEQVGLGEELTHPVTSTASIWSRGALRPMPARTLLGIPSDPGTLLGLLTAEEVERARHEVISGYRAPADHGGSPPALGAQGDISIGDLVGHRLGDAVVDRLVEPLLGGVYAGHARAISAAAALPAVFDAHLRGESLVQTAARALPALSVNPASAPPVFAGIRGGLHRLPTAVAARLVERGVVFRPGLTVRDVRRRGAGFSLTCGPMPAPETIEADLVVLATPPAPTSRILASIAPDAASHLANIELASMAIVTLALPADAVADLPGSGVLVPPVEELSVKATTFSANKWAWATEAGSGRGPEGRDVGLIRASVGRHRETAILQATDADLIPVVLADLRRMGLHVPQPWGWHVKRWGGALPQYAPGHRDTVAAIAASVGAVPGLAVCGAAYDGVGVPACIASGRSAAERVVASQ